MNKKNPNTFCRDRRQITGDGSQHRDQLKIHVENLIFVEKSEIKLAVVKTTPSSKLFMTCSDL